MRPAAAQTKKLKMSKLKMNRVGEERDREVTEEGLTLVVIISVGDWISRSAEAADGHALRAGSSLSLIAMMNEESKAS